jgi:transcriptional regulator with XRE-family HTH domain
MERGLTQADVAERLGRPQSFVSKYERGERRLDLVEFLSIADALSLDPCAVIQKLRRPGRRSA